MQESLRSGLSCFRKNPKKGVEHAQAAGFPFRRDVGGSGHDTRRGARRNARNWVGQ